MDEVHIRDMPGTVYLPAIDRPELDNAIRITQGKRQWRTVQINNHTRHRGIDICLDPVLESKYDPGLGIAIVPEFFVSKKKSWANTIRYSCTAVRY
jgi:hypothetical protein